MDDLFVVPIREQRTVVFVCCHLCAVFQLCPLLMTDWPSAAHKGMLGSGYGVGG